MRNTGTPGVTRDIRAILRNAVQEARALTLQGKSVDHLPDELFHWFLTDGNEGRGWGHERVRFPKIDAVARRERIEQLLAADFSSTSIAEIVGGISASTVRTIAQELRAESHEEP